MLKSLLDTEQPEKIAVIFDAPGKTFRSDWYPEYKAHRPVMPEDLQQQIRWIHEVVAAMGLPIICVSGVEADDVIGTLAHQATAKKLEVVIVSSDKDLTQLVNAHITLMNTMTGVTLNRATVMEKFGVFPESMIDYLALMGDASDNVPGVPGVGPKTAVKWLAAYGSVENIIAHAAEIPGKVGVSLRTHLDKLVLSKKLVTIVTHLDLPITIDSLIRKPLDIAALLDIYDTLEFTALAAALRAKKAAVPATELYDTITTLEALHAWALLLNAVDLFSLVITTTNRQDRQAPLTSLAFALSPQEACYIPLDHAHSLSVEQIFAVLQPILEDCSIKKTMHDAKYAYAVLKNTGITLRGIAADSMLMSYVYNSVASSHTLQALALKYLHHSSIALGHVAEQAKDALALHHYFSSRLTSSLAHVLYAIDLPLVTILADMELQGVCVDKNLLEQQSRELEKRLQHLEQQAYQYAGAVFNLNSPLQLQEILFEKLGLPILKKTPKGQPSTAEEVLSELALDYPLPRCLIEYRQLHKLKTTYTDQLPKQIYRHTGRIHSSFHQALTATGRLSSSHPNLQNIPIRNAEGKKIRHAFIAPKECCLIAADYSQIELRIMAHLSQDVGLQQAFHAQQDVHQATAAEIFHVARTCVTPEQRRSAKAINFGLIYGMSSFGLAKQLGIERSAAQAYIERYFERYPGVQQYMEKTRALAHQQGYVETLFGRRLYLPLIHAANKSVRHAAERMAINAPMQGTAADIMKLAMIQVSAWLTQQAPTTKTILQVHDELIFEAPQQDAQQIAATIQVLMEKATTLSVPLVVQIGIGSNWGEAH